MLILWTKIRHFVEFLYFCNKNMSIMLEATRREANELFVLFSLLGKGEVVLGDALGKAVTEREKPRQQGGHEPNPQDEKARRTVSITKIIRQENGQPYSYEIEEDTIRLSGPERDERFPREDFQDAAAWLLQLLTERTQTEGESSTLDLTPLEPFLDALGIYSLKAQTYDRTDLHLVLWDSRNEALGVRIQSRLCGFSPLLDGGRLANLKFEQTGVRFSSPAMHKINWTEEQDTVAAVARRILYMQSLGAQFKYSDVADKVFKSNLLMLDTNLPRILASMLMTSHLDGISRIDLLTAAMEEKNPLKLKEELVRNHGIYRYKMRQLLLALAWGMRPTTHFDGRSGSIGGYLMVDSQGRILLYSRADEQTFSDYLFTHTRLEKSSPEVDKYGILERENGAFYLKLNLKIGLNP